MSLLITLLLYVSVLGVVYWLIASVIPLPPTVRTIALVIFALVVLVILFDLLAGHPLGLPGVR